MRLSLALIVAAILLYSHSQAQPALWAEITSSEIPRQRGARLIVPRAYRLLKLDVAQLEQRLIQNDPLELPLPDGRLVSFRLEPTDLLPPTLAEKYPALRTYRGHALTDPAMTLRLDWTPHGLHALIFQPTGTVFIDPYQQGQQTIYLSYEARDYQNIWGKRRQDELIGEAMQEVRRQPRLRIGGQQRRYRLAVATTGEYAQFHGGTRWPRSPPRSTASTAFTSGMRAYVFSLWIGWRRFSTPTRPAIPTSTPATTYSLTKLCLTAKSVRLTTMLGIWSARAAAGWRFWVGLAIALARRWG